MESENNEERKPAQRPKRYNQPDKQQATRGSWSFSPGTKSATAMLRGTECWTCTRSLPLAGTNGLGPRYCMECLQKKYKSVRRGMALVNKLIVRKKAKKTASSNAPWVRKNG